MPEWRGLAKIGLVLPFHGGDPAAAMATHEAVRELLIAQNRAGGIGGQRFELVSLDSGGDSTTLERRFRELSLDPLVVAVLAPPDPAAESAAARLGVRYVPVHSPADARAAAERALVEAAARR